MSNEKNTILLYFFKGFEKYLWRFSWRSFRVFLWTVAAFCSLFFQSLYLTIFRQMVLLLLLERNSILSLVSLLLTAFWQKEPINYSQLFSLDLLKIYFEPLRWLSNTVWKKNPVLFMQKKVLLHEHGNTQRKLKEESLAYLSTVRSVSLRNLRELHKCWIKDEVAD